MQILKSNSKSIDIRANVETVFEFINDPLNWLKWSIVNLKSISAGHNGWYEIETKQGPGQLKMFSAKEYGILDHQWKNAEANWIVPCRVVPNLNGSTFIMTFFQPSSISDEIYSALMAEIDVELSALKKVLENLY